MGEAMRGLGNTGISRLPEILARFKRVMNMDVTMDKNGLGYQFRLPGFKYDDFDRSGNLSIFKLNMLANISRHMDVNLISDSKNRLNFFFFASQWNVSQALYEKAALQLPMLQRGTVGSVGTKSIDLLQTFINESDGMIVASHLYRLVNINPDSKTSVPLLESDRQRILEGIRGMETRKIQDTPVPTAIPDDSFRCKILVRHEDMDHLFHSNQSSYLGFALECAARAALAGRYKHFSEDICFYRIETVTGIHLQESFAGDELDVFTWQDTIEPLLLYFVVQKQGQTIYHARIKYYDT